MNYITVSQLNNYLKRKFEADVHLESVLLKGEISNCTIHSKGHIYFSLKDETSVIGAVMFNQNASKLAFEPKDGTKVFVEGRVTVYEASGKYQIVVSKMQPDGIGELYIAFEKLKKKLSEEGLFRDEIKKPIPKYPKRIGIVTAPTGAAIRDILITIKDRFPICETLLFPALVQGEEAKFSIVSAIEEAQNYDLDVLIVGRGGGSIEDLWAFNEEIVARAIYDSKIPVISAVGHEIDVTIADFVADVRAATPTRAAELAVPNMRDVWKNIENIKIRLTSNVQNKLEVYEKKIDALKGAYVLRNPLAIYEVREQKLCNLMDILNSNVNKRLSECSIKYKHLIESRVLTNPNEIISNQAKKYELILNKLELLNPLGILKKGYAVVTINGTSVKNSKDLKVDDEVDIKFGEGMAKAVVKEINE